MKSPIQILLTVALPGAASFAQEQDTAFAGTHGGLILQLGADDLDTPAHLSKTGRYVIHVVDTDESKIDHQLLRDNGVYGLVSAEHRSDLKRLPYAENVVNGAIVHRDFGVSAAEFARVLTPGAQLSLMDDFLSVEELEAAGFEMFEVKGGIVARLKWPEEMDIWSHPRHSSSGNAVSQDTTIGPPDRVRWVAAATWEVEGLVTAGGRNFYGGILARNSFNGLRLWHRELATGGELNTPDFKLPRLPRFGPRPVASEQLLFAILDGKVVAIDSASGQVRVEFGGIEQPRALLHLDGVVVAAGTKSVRAFDVESGDELWNFEAAEPHNLIAGSGFVSFIHGRPKRGEKSEAVMLDFKTGEEFWRKSDFAWLDKTTRTVLYEDHLAFEVSTLTDHDAGNGIYVVDAHTGEFNWEKTFPPAMSHRRQARALFVDDAMWILHGARVGTETEKPGRVPSAVSALELDSGEVLTTHKAGMAHCFPPVATPNFVFAGELDLTDMRTGDVVANRITKANCSSENGWVPSNGLIYTTPKHCTCWPMLRGFVAMAPAAPEGGDHPAKQPIEEIDFKLERSGVALPENIAAQAGDWPVYRADKWRSGSTKSKGPSNLEIAWRTRLIPDVEVASLAAPPVGPILHDWRENPYIKGPLTAPVVANGVAFLARPDAHEVLGVKADGSGEVVWRFNANGRVDAPPSFHKGLVLFGTHNGYVYALRADSGEQVWRLNANPVDERIVAYGQVESPWPVPGSILLDEDVAYFVAGRQELADGGVLVFAVDPMTGEKHWVHRIDTVPQKGFYENSGLEFDPVDIPFVEGDRIAMSRWLITKDGKEASVDKWNAFAKVNVGGEGLAWVPRGFWTYGARHQYRFAGEAPKRPLCVFRGKRIVGQLNGSTTVYMRDFDLENGEEFESKWITGWAASGMARKGEKPYRSHRIAEEAAWKVDPFRTPEEQKALAEQKPGTQVWNDVYGMVLAGDDRVFMIHKDGRIVSLNTETGEKLAEAKVDNPVWDSLVLANQQLLLTTMTGDLVCLGAE